MIECKKFFEATLDAKAQALHNSNDVQHSSYI